VGTVTALLLFSAACSATEARIIRERPALVKREVLLFSKDFLLASSSALS
jgi:hypothetical protein